MTSSIVLVLAEERLLAFPALLREAGVPVDPQRVEDFLRAAKCVPLRGLDDLKHASRITLARSPDEIRLHDAVFAAWFADGEGVAEMYPTKERQAPANRPEGGSEPLDPQVGEAQGVRASHDESRTVKSFGRARGADRAAQAALVRALLRQKPVLSRRWVPAEKGARVDLAATARAARGTFGEAVHLNVRTRSARLRRLLLLVDVSGSMKNQSEIALRFAHGLVQAHDRVEVFCFGTRLTRVTRLLRHRDADRALTRLTSLVFDFDGGTRIGVSLEAFLAVSRYAALTRGADVLVISDGLETGDPIAMVAALHRVARLSHRIVLVTPLAADPHYQPRTRALKACLGAIDAIADGATPMALVDCVAALPLVAARLRGRAKRLSSNGDRLP